MMNARNLFAALLLIALPFTVWGQDDMYFASKKNKTAKAEKKAEQATRYSNVEIVYVDDDDDGTEGISGSNRDIDEYNRRAVRKQSTAGGQLVENPDGTFTYRVSGKDTLYVVDDTTAITTRRFADDLYSQGYNEGYMDGEDFAYSNRLGRFGYSSIYTSPWRYSCWDPYLYDSWYWGYDPYWYGGYYGWHRPYWGYAGWYWGYDPYWYGGYYGWHRPYGYGGYYGGGHHHHHYGGGSYRRGSYDGRVSDRYANNRTFGRTGRPGAANSGVPSVRRGQDSPLGQISGRSNRSTSSSGGNVGISNRSNSTNSVRSSSSSSSRSSSTYGGSRIGGGESSSRSVSSGSSSRSSGSFGGGSSIGGGSSRGGGGFGGGGGGRIGGGGGGSRGGGSRR